MELYDVMRTTFSAREFTADPVPDDVVVKISNFFDSIRGEGRGGGFRLSRQNTEIARSRQVLPSLIRRPRRSWSAQSYCPQPAESFVEKEDREQRTEGRK